MKLQSRKLFDWSWRQLFSMWKGKCVPHKQLIKHFWQTQQCFDVIVKEFFVSLGQNCLFINWESSHSWTDFYFDNFEKSQIWWIYSYKLICRIFHKQPQFWRILKVVLNMQTICRANKANEYSPFKNFNFCLRILVTSSSNFQTAHKNCLFNFCLNKQ